NMYIASVGDKPSHRKYLVEDVDPGDGDEYIRVIGKLELCDDIDDRDQPGYLDKRNALLNDDHTANDEAEYLEGDIGDAICNTSGRFMELEFKRMLEELLKDGTYTDIIPEPDGEFT
ncbi:MAG: hypothetical protein K6G22_12950, partial [Lachnospiraceae bacterium]|nr:hypothetical protein [Lachnospiraceae bacterium]